MPLDLYSVVSLSLSLALFVTCIQLLVPFSFFLFSLVLFRFTLVWIVCCSPVITMAKGKSDTAKNANTPRKTAWKGIAIKPKSPSRPGSTASAHSQESRKSVNTIASSTLSNEGVSSSSSLTDTTTAQVESTPPPPPPAAAPTATNDNVQEPSKGQQQQQQQPIEDTKKVCGVWVDI